MIVNKFFKGSVGQSALELVLIVVGVLVALWVDEWRGDREEKEILQQHLLGVVDEINQNLSTIHKIRDSALPEKMQALGVVIYILSQPEPDIDDPEKLIETLASSSWDLHPWFVRNRFDALRTSGSLHSLHIQKLASDLSDAFEAPKVLFSQPLVFEGNYSEVVQELIPARYQSKHSQLKSYVVGNHAPVILDNQSAEEAVRLIVSQKSHLVRLARNEAAVDTGKWYAMTRIKQDFESVRMQILKHPLLQGIELLDTAALQQLDSN